MVEAFLANYGTGPAALRQRLQPPPPPIRGRTVDMMILDEATWRDIIGPGSSGVIASVQAPLQVSQVIPQPLNRRTPAEEYRDAVAELDAEEHMVAQIMAEEDRRIFDTLDAIAAGGFESNPDTRVRPVQLADLEQAREFLEQHAFPPGAMYVASEPEFVGRMPVRSELTVLGADPPRAPLGFAAYEEPGIGLVNPAAARRVTMPTFEIASNPTIRLEDVQARRFDLMDRGRTPDRKAVLMASVIWESFLASRFSQRVEEGPDEPSVLDM